MNVVGVRFEPIGRLRYFDPGDEELGVGDRVVVAAEEGEIEGVVAIAPEQVLYSELKGQLGPVIRRLKRRDGRAKSP